MTEQRQMQRRKFCMQFDKLHGDSKRFSLHLLNTKIQAGNVPGEAEETGSTLYKVCFSALWAMKNDWSLVNIQREGDVRFYWLFFPSRG